VKFGGKEKHELLNPLSLLVVAEENDMFHHHFQMFNKNWEILKI